MTAEWVTRCAAALGGVPGAMVRCPNDGTAFSRKCPHCDVRVYACSDAHLVLADRTFQGHVMRVHPETISVADLRAIARDSVKLRFLLGFEEQNPGAFTDLLARIRAASGRGVS